MSIKKPKAIIFDWDNTIVDTHSLLHLASIDTMADMGMANQNIDYNEPNAYRSARDYLPQLFGDRWQEAAVIYRENYKKHRNQELKFLPDAKEMLDFLLKDSSVFLAIVSNKMGNTLREEVSMLDLHNHFVKIIGAEDTAEDKPSVVPVYHALEGTEILPSETWFVGDSEVDMICANNSGCISVFFGNEESKNNISRNLDINIHLNSHKELLGMLESIFLSDK